jgi:hypothetical protein
MKVSNLISKYTIKVFRVFGYLFSAFILLLILFYFAVQLPISQHHLTGKVENYLEQFLHTKVSINTIDLELPKSIRILGFYLEDQSEDTLVYFDRLEIDISPLALYNHKVKVNAFELDGTVCFLKKAYEDSIFNYDFIAQSFTSPQNKPNKEDSNWTFEVDEFLFLDGRFSYKDAKDSISLTSKVKSIELFLNEYGLSSKLKNATCRIRELESLLTTPNESLEFSLKEHFLILNQLDFNTSQVDIKALSFIEPFVFYEKQKKVPEPIKPDITDYSMKIPWQVVCAKLEIEEGSFILDDLNYPNQPGFDPNHLDIKQFSTLLKSLALSESGFASQLVSLKLREDDEFEIETASAHLNISDSVIRLDKLGLITPYSYFEGDLKVNYSNMSQLIAMSENVEISHQLDKGKIGSEDLLYFLPNLNDSTIPIEALNALAFQWKIDGTIGDIQINNFQIYNRETLAFNFGGHIKHILNPDSTIFNVELELSNSLFQLFKPYYTEYLGEIRLPSQLSLKSKFDGNSKNISFQNVLSTNKGSARVNGRFVNQNVTGYEIDAKISVLDMGYFLRQSTLGTIDMNIQSDGKGKNLDNSEFHLNSQISQLLYNGYSYKDIDISGDFKNKIGDLKFQIQDPNLQAEILSTINFAEELALTKVNLDITEARFKNLGITSDDVQATGSLSFEVIGADTDSLDVSIVTEDARIIKNGIVYETSPSSIKVQTGRNMSDIEIDFPFLKSYFKSNFPISNLQQVIVQEIIPTLISDSLYSNGTGHQMEFSITQFKQKIISNLLLPELKSLELKDFNGFYDGQSNKAGLLIDIPSMTYQDMHLDSLHIKVNANNLGLNFTGFLKELSAGTFRSHSLSTIGQASNGIATLSLELIDSLANRSLSIGTEIYPLDSGYKISIVQDSVVIGYEHWGVNASNKLIIGLDGINIQDFFFKKKNESFSIFSEDTLKNMPIHTKFKQFDLGYISKLIGPSQKPFSGSLNGEVIVHDLSSKLAFESDLLIKNFTYSDDEVGDIRLLAKKISEDIYELSFEAQGVHTNIGGNGYYSSTTDSIKMNLVLKEFDISTVQGFTSDYLQNLKGQLTGNLEAVGLIDKPSLSGKLNFHDVSFNTVYLGSFYNFKDEFIELKDDKIYFNQFKIYDKKENLATVDGFVGSNDLESYVFNLDLSTNKFELLNTKSTGNKDQLYFGNLVLSSNLKIRGNSTKPIINANAKVIGGSEVTVIAPKTQAETIEYEGIVKFISQDTSLQRVQSINTNQSSLIGISLQSNLEILPEAKLKIIIDQDAGDFLEVKGKSAMSYTIDPSGEVNLSGTYEVSEGVYNLTFYNFLKKQFLLKKGSTIRWTGDPYDALLNASASYIVNTSPLPLIESQLSPSDRGSESAYQQVLPFIVNLNISGAISKPQIQFGIELPPNKQNFQGGVVNSKIQQLNAQESELNKQVFSLLLFNRFLPENSFSGGASGALSSTARNSVSKLLTQQLNGLTGKYIKGITINTDIESFEDYSTGSARGRTDLKLELSKELFNERLVVKVGSNVPLEGDKKQSGVRNLAQDIVLEYKLDEDGSYRLKAFRKNQYEGIIDGELTKTGIGMTLSREFETWEELLLSLKATQK